MQESSPSGQFLRNAQELAVRLGEFATVEAMTLTREATLLVETFKGWETSRPTDEARVASIQQLFELQRKAMDFLSRQSKPPSSRSPGSPPSSRRPGLIRR